MALITFTQGEKLTATKLNSLAQQAWDALSDVSSGGTIDGVTIGGTTPAAGAFTTLAASGAVSGAGFTALFASPPAIGGTAAAAGRFTTLAASGAVSGAGFTALFASPPAIGGTAAAAAAFTTLAASGAVSGAGFTALFASPPAIGGTAPAAATLSRMLIAASGTPAALPRMFQMTSVTGNPGAGTSIFRVGGNYYGALTSSLVGVWQFVMDTENMTVSDPASMGVTAFDVAANMTSGWSGGRALHKIRLNVNAAGTGAAGTFLVASAAFAEGSASAGGTAAGRMGSLFGNNTSARLNSAAARYWRGVVGQEVNVGVYDGAAALDEVGAQVVQWADSASRGLRASAAYKVAMQKNGTAPGFRTFYQLGGEDGWWPGTETSSVMRAANVASGGPAYLAAAGIDLSGITFGDAAYRSTGFLVDGSGNVGGTAITGKELRTRSAIKAGVCTVSGITVIDGGLFSSGAAVTLTLDAPPDSGATATASVATQTLSAIEDVTAAGTGYQVGDTYYVAGGTYSTQAVLTVDKVGASGELQGAYLSTAGDYSVLPGPGASLTPISGSGSGATVSFYSAVLTVTVIGAGSNYPPGRPPAITWGGTDLRRPIASVALSEVQSALLLNDGLIDVTGIPTSASGLAAGRVWSNGGVLTVVT